VYQDHQDVQAAEEENRLHGVEADLTILFLQEEENNACYPAEYVAENGFNSRIDAERREGRAHWSVVLLVVGLLSVVGLLLIL